MHEQLRMVDPKLLESLKERHASFNVQLQEIWAPLRKIRDTGDRRLFNEEIKKMKNEEDTEKKGNQKSTILEEISENSLQLKHVKVKKEKISSVSSKSTSSVASGTFLKEMSPKVSENHRRTRQRKPSTSENAEPPIAIERVRVKREKLSAIISQSGSDGTSEATITDVDVEVKKEDMPAPKRLPPRKKKTKPEAERASKRSTRASDNGKQSDVIIQNTTITKIDITDCEFESPEKKIRSQPEKSVNQITRTTRSKVKQKKPSVDSESDADNAGKAELEVKKVRSTRTKTRQNKRNRSNSIDEEMASSKEQKKPKSSASSDNDDNKAARVEYERRQSMETSQVESQNQADATYVAEQPALNQTVVVEKYKSAQSNDVNEEKKEETMKTKKGTKEMFSPYVKTPVKKKVEAFEKLEAAALQESDSKKSKPRSETKSSTVGRPKSKIGTPFSSKFIPKTCSTNKVTKLHPSSSKLDTSMSSESSSGRSLSAMKASQAAFREREKLRQEKEREALKKREALLAARTEEKRRHREEKQLKAQQQREHLEKERQKQWEEAEKKRIIAKKKAQLIKQHEEREARIAAEKEKLAEREKERERERDANKLKSQRGQLPEYMICQAPLLPTDDCYDSDSSEYAADYTIPEWSKPKALKHQEMLQIVAAEKFKNTFYCRKTHTPDLRNIFQMIDPRKLKRTSSAVWKKPPRYTLFSVTSTVQFSEDEDIDV